MKDRLTERFRLYYYSQDMEALDYYSQDMEAHLAENWMIEEVLDCWKMLQQVEEVESSGEHCLSESWDKNE